MSRSPMRHNYFYSVIQVAKHIEIYFLCLVEMEYAFSRNVAARRYFMKFGMLME